MVCGKLLNTQPGTLCNMHLSVTRSEGGQLPRQGQQYHGLRPGAALLNLWYRRLCSGSKGNMRLDMAVFAWGHMMHEQDACGSFGAKLQCWKGRIGETHIGVSRGPQTLLRNSGDISVICSFLAL